MADVVLTYKHEGQMLSTGFISYRLLPGVGTCIFEFTKLTFPQMIARFAEALREHTDSRAVIARNDRPGLKEQVLEEEFTAMLRADPVAAIRAMTVAPVVVGKTRPVQGLAVGHDTLADTFGDYLYTRARKDAEVECPGCGRWTAIFSREDRPHDMSIFCKTCFDRGQTTRLAVELCTGTRWARFYTDHVLVLSHARFFFPRAWNKSRIWIEREDLKAMYDQYRQEREQACSEQARKQQ